MSVDRSGSSYDRAWNPEGWNEQRVLDLIEYYESQTDEEAVAKDVAAFGMGSQTVVSVPVSLLPLVRELIAKHQK
jgi:hypothetical protein